MISVASLELDFGVLLGLGDLGDDGAGERLQGEGGLRAEHNLVIKVATWISSRLSSFLRR